MAEVVSLVGQISTLVTLSHELITVCCCCISTIKDAPSELKEVRQEVSAFEHNIIGLQALINANPSEISHLAPLNAPDGTFHTATAIIKEFMDLLRTRPRPSSGPKRIKTMGLLEGLEWNIHKPRVKDLLEKLGRCRASIQLTLSAALAKPVVETRKDVGVLNRRVQAVQEGQFRFQESQARFQEDQAQFQNDTRKLDALRWFSVDLSENKTLHKEKLSQQEASTCAWFTRDDVWKEWIKHGSFIWVTGMPGTGKTVLASYLIEQASNAFSTRGVAYYYCHHSRNKDESVPLLRAIVKQLISHKGHVPRRIYERSHSDTELDANDLLDCLEELSHVFERGVRIIVDAVDESKPRDNLTDILFTIGTDQRFHRVFLLVTSRPEADICDAIKVNHEFVTEISMCNPGVQADIQHFVHSELNKSRWDDFFRREIEQCLVGGARGMFRWVACQLEHIKRLGMRGTSGQQAVRHALLDLPDDIFKTYERILLEIPSSDREFARTALALVCSDHGEIPTAEILVEACLYRVRSEDISKYDVKLLADICGCLLRISNLPKAPHSAFIKDAPGGSFHRVSLAHYTVKEYLVHANTAKGPAKFFALNSQVLETIDLVVAFKGLQRFGFRHTLDTGNSRVKVTRYEEYCLKKTQTALIHRRADFDKSAELYQAVLQSLKYTSVHAEYLRKQRGIVEPMNSHCSTWDKLINQLETPPLGRHSEQVGLIFNLTTLGWLHVTEKYLSESPDFTCLHQNDKATIWTTKVKLKPTKRDETTQDESLLLYCVRHRKYSFLATFINHGATFESEPEILYTAMYSLDKPLTSSNTTLRFLRAMLELGRGANPNPTPAQPGDRLASPEERNKTVKRFAFTPLQVAVILQEQEWAEVLLETSANPNGKGVAGGIIPHGYTRGNNIIDLELLSSMSERTPLEICRRLKSKPTEDHQAGSENPMVGLLRRWGATEPPDIMEISDTEDEEDSK